MKSFFFTLIIILFPIIILGQENLNNFSFTYFNDITIGTKTFESDIFGQNDYDLVLMDNETYRNTFQIEYERFIIPQVSLFSNIGISTRNFKSMIETFDRSTSVYYTPQKQNYNFFNLGLGLKYYIPIEKVRLFAKVGFSHGSNLNKPNDVLLFNTTEVMHFATKLNNLILGLGLSNQINEDINYRIEFNLSHSFDPIIKEIENSEMTIIGLGLGLGYNF